MCDKKKQSQAKKESLLFYLVWIKKLKARTTICSINKLLTLQEKLGLMVLGVRFRNLEIGVRIEEFESDFLGLVTLHLCNQSTLRYLAIACLGSNSADRECNVDGPLPSFATLSLCFLGAQELL